MESKIQLIHPEGKKAVKMDIGKYDVLQTALIDCLKQNGALTHKELMTNIVHDFEKNNRKFNGSIPWHLEWVKLDLEARKVIERKGEKSAMKYTLR